MKWKGWGPRFSKTPLYTRVGFKGSGNLGVGPCAIIELVGCNGLSLRLDRVFDGLESRSLNNWHYYSLGFLIIHI